MGKRSVFAIAVSLVAAALVACGGSAGKNQKLSDSADSLSYVIGMNIAYNIMKMDSTLRPEVIMAGLADAMQGQEKISLEDGKFYLLSYMNYDVYERVRKYEDQYLTDPVPEGKPHPVEPEDQKVDKDIMYTCTFSIECSTILNNLDMLDPEKLEMVPSDGVILAEITVVFYEGESVFDVLQRVCRENNIHMEASWTPMYNSAYIEGIHNLYEFDCGALSGWMYRVNGWYPNYGCSRYQLQDGDVVEWRFTCDLGNDVGGGYAIGG